MNKKQKNQYLADAEYERKKKDHTTAMIAQFFGVGRLYVGSYARWFVFVVSMFLYVGWLRWIIDFFVLYDMVTQYNKALKLEIDVKYDLV